MSTFPTLARMLAVLMSIFLGNAEASVMTFGGGAPVSEQQYSENGFILDQTTLIRPFLERIRNWQTTVQGPMYLAGGYGEREYLFNEFSGVATFSREDGGKFALFRFDIENPAGQVQWAVGGTFSIDASNGYHEDIFSHTYYPGLIAQGEGGFVTLQMNSALTDISWVSISCVRGCQLALDNIEFQVPEPNSAYLFLFLLLLRPLGVSSRKRPDFRYRRALSCSSDISAAVT